MHNKKQLLKEASEVINDLTNELNNTKTLVHELQTELSNIKDLNRREKLAMELEKKGLTSYEELERIKRNNLDPEELNRLEKMSELDTSYISEIYENDNNASYTDNDDSSPAVDYRIQYFLEQLKN